MAWTKARHYEWSDEWSDLLANLFPEHHHTVAATCRIELRGKLSNRSQGKTAYATAYYALMQSYGEIPVGFTGVQTRGYWIQTTNRESIDAIMGAFGLTFDQLIDIVGIPEDNESREIALHDAIVGCDAEFALQRVAEVA